MFTKTLFTLNVVSLSHPFHYSIQNIQNIFLIHIMFTDSLRSIYWWKTKKKLLYYFEDKFFIDTHINWINIVIINGYILLLFRTCYFLFMRNREKESENKKYDRIEVSLHIFSLNFGIYNELITSSVNIKASISKHNLQWFNLSICLKMTHLSRWWYTANTTQQHNNNNNNNRFDLIFIYIHNI